MHRYFCCVVGNWKLENWHLYRWHSSHSKGKPSNCWMVWDKVI